MGESSYVPVARPTYNHSRSDGFDSPCPECKRRQDIIDTHVALINLMSNMELLANLHSAWWQGYSDFRDGHGR